MKKIALLSVLALFFIASFGKCEFDGNFLCGSTYYHQSAENYIYHIDTAVDFTTSIPMQIHYYIGWDYIELTDWCANIYVVENDWKKNGVIVSQNSQFTAYTVSDTGLYEAIVEMSNGYFYYAYLHVTNIEESTSVNEIKNRTSFTLYPNPFTNTFSLEIKTAKASNLTYQIYDCTGRRIKEVTKENIFGDVKLTEDFETLSKGIYFLRIQIGEAIYKEKLVSL